MTISSHRDFLNDILLKQRNRRKLIDPEYNFPVPHNLSRKSQDDSSAVQDQHDAQEEEENGVISKDNVLNYIKEEETIRNDYCNWFGKSNELPSNYILGSKDEEICEEYPALKKLMNLKSNLVKNHSHQPLLLNLPFSSFSPSFSFNSILSSSLGNNNKFDVILINLLNSLTWEEISNLPIRQISSDPGFIFLWCGKGNEQGLERGRECFAKWGFRRAEDIVWVKTNKSNSTFQKDDLWEENEQKEKDQKRKVENGSLFSSQKYHCLMGIRGTVRRSTDTRFVHCNVDTDVMVWECDDESTSPAFPPYLYTLIENFCLGTRRLELFPTNPIPRRGWVTACLESPNPLEFDNEVQIFDPVTYPSLIPESDGKPILPYHTEIDTLRPKSPQRRPRNLPGGAIPGGGGGRPNSIPNSGFRPQNRQMYNQRNQQPQQMQSHMGDMGMQGFNQFNILGGGGNQMNPNQMMMQQMAMMNMGMGLPMPMPMPMGMGMGMIPFGQPQFPNMGMGLGMNMGMNNGQPGGFCQPQMNMPMGMGNMAFGFDPNQMNMNMGGYNQQNQSQSQSQSQGQGMGWQGNWQWI
ncbi:uncharacterized protein I206_103885 [Kwoniella pini CBS 10737]|uniref:Transcription regulator n=1 Tax=Kwoniella pini CBS 10737 TaxID=1296096 RepID=A0AAJ8L5X7_9TREE